MRLNWLGFNYRITDGYGRYNARMIGALEKQGVAVNAHFTGAQNAPAWLLERWGMSFDYPTISCMPPYLLNPMPSGAGSPLGAHWLLTMTEGGALPDGWRKAIEMAGVERVIVPCKHNAKVFKDGGVSVPISVIWGGTDPQEFPLWTGPRPERPYTFLTLGDRGKRKGWHEVYAAFYKAFGPRDTGAQDVRLIVKCTRYGNELVDLIRTAANLDPRVTFMAEDVPDIRDLYRQVDCLALPSRTEGWGMPHREAAMMGLPVITQAHSGLDDGHTHEWAIVLQKGRMEPIDDMGRNIAGEWMVCDIDELAATMRHCYENEWQVRKRAKFAREWLKTNQTWGHSASALIRLMEDEGLFPEEVTMEMEAMTWPS